MTARLAGLSAGQGGSSSPFRATRRGGGGSAGEAELSLKGQVPPSEASQREGCCTGVVSQEVGTRESVKAEKVNVKRSRARHGF